MSKWRTTCFLGVLLGISGLALTMPGCGPSGGQGGANPQVKVVPPVGSNSSTEEEYKNLSPAGKAVR